MKEIKLPRGSVAIVDDEDYEELSKYSWSIDQWGYVRRSVYDQSSKSGRSAVLMHRQVLGLLPDDGSIVDHIDRDPLNNKKFNLRLVSSSQNAMNRSLSSRNKSGLRGVYWSEASKKWMAVIQANRKKVHLGYFVNKEDAYAVYCTAAKDMHGEYSSVDWSSAPPLKPGLERHLIKRVNSSGYKGVKFNHRTNKWIARIMINGHRKQLGSFETPEAAHQVYCDAAKSTDAHVYDKSGLEASNEVMAEL